MRNDYCLFNKCKLFLHFCFMLILHIINIICYSNMPKIGIVAKHCFNCQTLFINPVFP
uniref:Uncharacterized protein n=1 Tax=Anguilla anguilla TaxID=7936 RepID=A0A0E9PF27_ANGAN